jgi:glycerophosphoryl diester phosphodiesterase
VIQSFSAESLKRLRSKHGCTLPLVYLPSNRDDTTRDGLAKIKQFADGLAPNKAMVVARPGLIADAHALGMSVTIWTCRTGQTGSHATVADEMAHFLKLGVDAIFTDNPDRFPRK